MKKLFLSPPHMSGEELALVQEAFAGNCIAPLGPMVDAFEQEFAEHVGIPHCLAVSSGTAAMHLALRELEMGPGDDVVASALTFIGGVSPITFLGGTPVFIDSDRETWNMDPDLLAEELADCARRGKLPKAVVSTDLYGQCCDLSRILGICDEYGIPVVCDSAEAMGARFRNAERGTRNAEEHESCESRLPSSGFRTPRWKHAGFGARAAVYSFNGNKIITTSGGGMLASHDEHLVEHARKLATQARDPAPHYEHSEIGYNYRMSNIIAAIGRAQLRVLEDRVARKRDIFKRYRELLGGVPGIEFMPEAPHVRANRWLTVILIDATQFGGTPEDVRQALAAENIEARPTWKPMHLQKVFEHCRFRGARGNPQADRASAGAPKSNRPRAVCEDLFARGLCLPSGTAMVEDDLARVSEVIRNVGRRRAVRSGTFAIKLPGRRPLNRRPSARSRKAHAHEQAR